MANFILELSFLLKTRINHLIIKKGNLLEIKNIHIFRESWGESTKIAVEYFIKLNKKDLVLRGIELNLLLNIVIYYLNS